MVIVRVCTLYVCVCVYVCMYACMLYIFSLLSFFNPTSKRFIIDHAKNRGFHGTKLDVSKTRNLKY